MKKIIILLYIFVCSTYIYPQGFYAKLGAGYALGTNTALINIEFDTNTVHGDYGSFGEGFTPKLSLGYMFCNTIGFEVGGTYLIGKKFEHEHVSGGLTETHKMWGEGILISPSIVITAPMKSVTPYVRFGGVLGLVKLKEEETESGTGARTGTNKIEHTGNIGLGISGALGVMFKAGKMLNIFAEIHGQGMNYAPGQRENTETFSGETPDPVITYEEEFPTNTSNTSLTPRIPFSNYGINVGVNLNFGKSGKTKK
ncbi:MAG TPA: hypothetical protein VGK25_12595 [Ignavibacteria bacterium]